MKRINNFLFTHSVAIILSAYAISYVNASYNLTSGNWLDCTLATAILIVCIIATINIVKGIKEYKPVNQ